MTPCEHLSSITGCGQLELAHPSSPQLKLAPFPCVYLFLLRPRADALTVDCHGSAGEPLSHWCANNKNFGKNEDPNETRAVFVVRVSALIMACLSTQGSTDCTQQRQRFG